MGILTLSATYDYATVHRLIDLVPVLHVSFNDPDHPFPAVLPMLGCTGNFAAPDADPGSSAQDIYVHGYVSSRLMKRGAAAAAASDGAGLPVTVAATHLDGVVLAPTPMQNSCNYRSAVAFGHAVAVTEDAEKLYALERITDMVPGRWADSRVPPTKAELTSTTVLRVRIASASAKLRDGGPHDDRADLADAELRQRVWTGVVPCWRQWGEPMPAKENRAKAVPAYVEKWRLSASKAGREGAYKAAEEKDSKAKTRRQRLEGKGTRSCASAA